MKTFARSCLVLFALATLATVACSKNQPDPVTATQVAPTQVAPASDERWAAIVADPDRTDDDRSEDASRKPIELLAFLGIEPGMKIADLGAGGGYLTELEVRATGPSGVVYAQNEPIIIEKYGKESWPARLARPINKSVVRVDSSLTTPLPPEAKDLDLVTMGFFYHDTVWLGTDRAKMNAAIFAALKPGGAYVILDHQSKPGAGVNDVKTLHRIEKQAVVAEVTKAGFVLAGEADFLANPADAHDTNVFEALRGKTDRFVLRFVKPASP